MFFSSRADFDSFLSKAQAILFDLDGTLIDLNIDWATVKETLQKYHLERFHEELTSTRFFLILQYIEKKYGADIKQDYLKLLKDLEFAGIKKDNAQMTWLGGKGLTYISERIPSEAFYGIISSNFHQTIEYIIDRHGIKSKFKFWVGRDDVTESKPNPEGLLAVIKKYDLDPKRTLYLGDNHVDEDAARDAHVPFIYIHDLQTLLKL